jgi:hypothetical protein
MTDGVQSALVSGAAPAGLAEELPSALLDRASA